MTKDKHPRLAVLIDADNAQASLIEGLLAEVAKFGIASVKRIYGDWTTPNLGSWKSALLEHSIHPIQQFRYTTGKNATDSAMIIDAMDLLYSGRFDGFCLVSSDSDFTRLASRIRETGLTVYGFGRQTTPPAFVSACDRFIYTHLLHSKTEPEEGLSNPPPKRKTSNELKQDTRLVNLLREAQEASSDDSGWANLGAVGNHIAKQAPDFDSRNYGYKKLQGLVEASQLFELESRQVGNNPAKVTFIRDKRYKTTAS
jgi:uncharacterized LabA/DUF88 family protein